MGAGAKRSGVIVLLATAIGAGAHADEPAAAVPDLKGEIRWASATWPDLFRGVRFRAPLPKLRAWVPGGGSIPGYLYTDKSCTPITLERARQTEDDEGYGGGAPALTGKIIGRTSVEKGRTVRAVRFVDVGEELTINPGSYTVESQDARGRWKSVGGTALGMEPNSYGWLSYADDRVARWDAQPQKLDIDCKGPIEWLACQAGGGRSCERCDDVSVSMQESGGENLNLLRGRPALPPATCTDPCPPHSDSPDIARLRRLEGRVQMWRSIRRRIADIPSLYKSRDDCLQEHPQVPRAASDEP